MDDASSTSRSSEENSNPQDDARQRRRGLEVFQLITSTWQKCYPQRKMAGWAGVIFIGTTVTMTILYFFVFMRQPHAAHRVFPKQRNDTESPPVDGLERWKEDFSTSVIPIMCHSYNDYWRPDLISFALAAGCTGTEAEIWLDGTSLLVGHDPSELHPDRTLRSVFLDPLLEILSQRNPDEQWANHTVYDRARGVFSTQPNSTLTLLISVKTDPQKAWEIVTSELRSLRAKQFLTRYKVVYPAPGFQEKQTMWPGPITVVGTGNMNRDAYYRYANSRQKVLVDGDMHSDHYEYHDFFYDAPLEALPNANTFTQGLTSGMGFTGSKQMYHAESAYFASASFNGVIGSVRMGFSRKQLDSVREQIYTAKKSNLKSRYYDLPSWPANYRDYVWDVLSREGVDMLSTNDLESVVKRGWSKGYTRTSVWMTLVSVCLFSILLVVLWVSSKILRAHFHLLSFSTMSLTHCKHFVLQNPFGAWNGLIASNDLAFSNLVDTTIAAFAFWSTKCILSQQRYYHPLHLLLAQLLATWGSLLWEALYNHFSVNGPQRDHIVLLFNHLKHFTTGGCVLAGAAIIVLSFTLPLFSQAFLHLPNFTTLAMVLSLVALADSIRNTSLPLRQKLFAVSIVAIATASVLYDEHRLTVEGLLFGLPAIIGIFLSKTLVRFHRQRRESRDTEIESGRNTVSDSERWILDIALLASLVVTGIWTLCIESTVKAAKSLGVIDPWLLLLNAAAVAYTLTRGLCHHFLFGSDKIEKLELNWNRAHIFLFAGLCALFNQGFKIPFLSSTIQIGCFTLAFCSLYFLTKTSVSWNSFEQANELSEYQPSMAIMSVDSADELDTHPAELERLISLDKMEPPETGSDILSPLESDLANLHHRQSPNPLMLRTMTSTIITLLFAIWIGFFVLNYHRLGVPLQPRSIPITDSAYQSQFDLDIVISMYNEEPASVVKMLAELKALPIIQRRSTRIFVYYKGDSDLIFNLEHHLANTKLIYRPNVGREGETYLYHILSRRDMLATHTLFLQAHVHNPWEMHRRIDQYFVPSTGMLSLGFSGYTCDCGDCFDRWGWREDKFQSLYAGIYNTTCSTALLSYKGQFIASAQRLRGIDAIVYKHMHDALVDPESWAHTEPYLQGRPDEMSAPHFGFTLERMWSVLLQCSDLDIALKCPTTLSGKRIEGDVSDCQCLDPT